MLGLEAARQAIVRDLDSMLGRLEALDDGDWQRPTPCDGWTIADMVGHMCGTSRLEAELLAKRGSGEPAAGPQPRTGGPAELLASLREGRDILAAALGELDESSMSELVTYPAGSDLVLPVQFALQVSAIEFGFHRHDLDVALDGTASLEPDALSAAIGLAGGMLPWLARDAAEDAPDGLAFALRSPGVQLTLVRDGGAWTAGEANGGTVCTIEGDDESLALFAMGRRAASHERLRVSDPELASR